MSEQFKVLIVADISKALKSIDEVKKDLKSIGTTNISSSNLNSTENKLKGIKELLKGVVSKINEGQGGFKNLGSSLSSFTSSGSAGIVKLTTKMAGLATVATGVGAVLAGMVKTAQEVAKIGDKIDKGSQKIGFSRRGYLLWSAVTNEAGLDSGTFTSSAERVLTSRNDAITGNEDKTSAFAKLGISLADLQSMSGEDLFLATVFGILNLSNEIDKATLSNELFGRSYYELVPLLNMTNEEVQASILTYENLGGLMSDRLVSNSAALEDSISKLKFAFQGFANTIGAIVVPVVTGVIDVLTKLASAVNWVLNKLGGFFGSLFGITSSATESVSSGVDKLNNGLKYDSRHSILKETASDAESATAAVGGTTAAVKLLKRALLGFDELNIVADPSKNQGGGGGGGLFLDVVQKYTGPKLDSYGRDTQYLWENVDGTPEDSAWNPNVTVPGLFGESVYDTTGKFGYSGPKKDDTSGIKSTAPLLPPDENTPLRNPDNPFDIDLPDVSDYMANPRNQFYETDVNEEGTINKWLKDLFKPNTSGKVKMPMGMTVDMNPKQPKENKAPSTKTPTNPDAGSRWKKDSKDLSGYTSTMKQFNTTASTTSKTVKSLGTGSTATASNIKYLAGTTNDMGLATKQLNLNIGTSNSAFKTMSESSKNAVASMGGIGKSIKDANTNLKEFPNITDKVKTSTNGLNSYWDETVTNKYAVSTWENNYGNIEKGASNALPKVKTTVETNMKMSDEFMEQFAKDKLSESTWKTKFGGVDTGASKGLNGVKSTVETALKNVNTAMDNETKDSLSETKWIGRFDSVKTGASKSLKGADAEIKQSVTEMNKTLEGVAIKWTLDSSFKSTMNKCISYAQEGIRSIATGFNRLGFDVPASVKPGTTFRPNVSNNISLAHLAKGGIVDSETPFIAGEAGKEVVMPLENNTGWIDLLAQRLSEKTGGNSPTTLVMKVGETELGRATIASINNITRSTGELPLILA